MSLSYMADAAMSGASTAPTDPFDRPRQPAAFLVRRRATLHNLNVCTHEPGIGAEFPAIPPLYIGF